MKSQKRKLQFRFISFYFFRSFQEIHTCIVQCAYRIVDYNLQITGNKNGNSNKNNNGNQKRNNYIVVTTRATTIVIL